MRAAIVSDYFPDYVGGAQTSMREQLLALTEAGREGVLVSAVRGRGPYIRREAGWLGIRPNYTLPGVQLPVIPNNARTRDVLREHFVSEAIEVVHVQSEFGLAHAAADVAAELGLPVVHTVHTFYWASEGSWHAPLAPLLRWRLRAVTGRAIPRVPLSSRAVDDLLRNLTLGMALRADAVVSPSAHQARDLEAAGVASVTVMPNPIATSPVPSTPLTLEQASPPRLLWVARCDAVKRPLVFARGVVEALKRTGGGFSVDFVGDGAELPALRRLVEGHAEVRVHGALPHERVLELMDASSAVVLSSLGFDNQPMTIAEAVSRQRGVLYCDPKLQEGLAGSGCLTENPDESGFTDALVALADDPSRLVQMSEGAAADAAEFAPATYVDRILAVYAAARS